MRYLIFSTALLLGFGLMSTGHCAAPKPRDPVTQCIQQCEDTWLPVWHACAGEEQCEKQAAAQDFLCIRACQREPDRCARKSPGDMCDRDAACSRGELCLKGRPSDLYGKCVKVGR